MNAPDQESLRELLRRVHERLSGAERMEAESRELLVTLTRDIERALGAARPRGPLTASVERLEALAVQFEAGHPALAQALRQLIDALGKAGI